MSEMTNPCRLRHLPAGVVSWFSVGPALSRSFALGNAPRL